MKTKSIQITMAAVLLGALTTGLIGSGSSVAATATQSAKEKAAAAVYSKTMAKARADFLAAVKPSRDAVIATGKPAETARRAKVKTALAAFNAVVGAEKAPSIAAEKSYKIAVGKLKLNPKDATLKANTKSSLLVLTQSAAALKVDAKIVEARKVFAAARVSAMAEFKSTIASAVKARDAVQAQELAKFKATKARALATLNVSLKQAKATTKTGAKKKK